MSFPSRARVVSPNTTPLYNASRYAIEGKKSSSLLSAIPAKQAVQKLRGHPANKPYPAIPAKAGIQHNKRALRAPFKAGAGRPVPAMCAYRAQFARDSCFRRNDEERGGNKERELRAAVLIGAS